MNFQSVQLSGCAEAVVIDDLTVSDIHRPDSLHLLPGQRKIPDIHIFRHPLLMDRPGNHRNVSLEMPAENHLGRRLSIFFPDFDQNFMMEDILLAFT